MHFLCVQVGGCVWIYGGQGVHGGVCGCIVGPVPQLCMCKNANSWVHGKCAVKRDI